MLDFGVMQRSGVSPWVWLLGPAVGVSAGLILAADGYALLAVGFLSLGVVVVTVSRPDLAVGVAIVALPLFGYVAVLSMPGLPDITVGRILVLWSLIVVAKATAVQKRQLVPLSSDLGWQARDSLTVWVGIFLSFMLLASLRSPSLSAGLQRWLDSYLLPFASLLILCRYRWSRRETDVVVTVYLACCCAWSATGLVEFLTRRSFFAADGLLPWVYAGDPFGRTGGPFINPAFLGTAVGIGLVVAWEWAGRSGIPRVVALASIPMCAIGLTVSLTRASWLGAAGGMLVTLSFARSRRVAVLAIAISGLAVVVLVIVSLFGANVLESRATSRFEAFNRIIVQRSAVQIIADNPLLGVGSDRFASLSRQNLHGVESIPGSFGIGVAVPHNSILFVMVDGGLGAGASLVVVVGVLIAVGRRRLSSPALRHLGAAAVASIVVITVNALFIDMWLAVPVTTLALMVIGVILSDPDPREVGNS